MPSRVLETVLTGKNLLSPVLTGAARDVEDYTRRVEGANADTATSATTAADAHERASERIVEANAKTSQSTVDTAAQMQSLRREIAELGQQKVGVDVDAADARAQLDELRLRLAEVAAADPTAKVDADVAAASAQIQIIQAELNRIDGETVTARVAVDDGGSIARATSGIGALKSLAVGLSPALLPIGAVGAAGFGAVAAGATAALPVLGAAALGFAGTADAVKLLNNQQLQATLDGQKLDQQSAQTAAAQASAARQVASAQAALSNARANAADAAVRADEQVTKSRQSLVRAEQDAARSVSDAQKNLTQARADAARQEQQADQSVTDARNQATADVTAALGREQDAERSLALAQRDARQAQDDLTAARKTAEQQIEDTTNSVADNALAQRQAVLDLADARRKLAEAQGGGDATAIARAQLALDQQIQRQKELLLQGQRLKDQQQENTRTGVEGSAQVVAAQQRVADASQKVADADRNARNAAEEVQEARADGAKKVADAQQKAADVTSRAQAQVADAQERLTRAQTDGAQKVADAQAAVADAVRQQAVQQRQSAYSVQQAQASLAGAMAAVAAASQTAGNTASGSMARIQAQLDQVNPATLQFAQYVQGKLVPAWQQLEQANAGQLLPRTQLALQILMTQMPQVTRFTSGLSAEMGDLEVAAAKALTGPFWQQFFTDVESRGVPLLDDLGRSAGHLATGAAGIVQAFLPMGTSVADGIERASERFADWGAQLKDSNGFHEFSDYVRREWPEVEQIVENVAGIVTKLVEAGMPIGGAYLTGFRLLSDVLAGLPVPVVQALLTAFLAFKVGSGVSEGIRDSAKSVQGLAKGLESVAGNSGKLSGLVGTLGSIGSAAPVAGLGIGLITAAIGGVVAIYQQHKQAVAEDTAQILEWKKAQDSGGDGAVDASRKLAGFEQKLRDAEGAYQRAAAAAESSQAGTEGYAQGVAIAGENVKELRGELDAAQKKYQAYRDSLTPVQAAQIDVTRATNDLNAAIRDYGAASPQAVDAANRYRQAQQNLTTQQDDVKRATEGATGAIYDQITAQEAATGSDLGFQSSLLNTKSAIGQYKASLSDSTKTTEEHQQAEIQVAQSIYQTVQAAGKKAEADNVGKSQADINAASVRQQRDTFNELTKQLGYVPPALKTLGDSLNSSGSEASLTASKMSDLGFKVRTLPDGHHIEIDAPTDRQMAALQALGVKTQTLPNGSIVVDANTLPASDKLDQLFRNYQHVEYTGTAIRVNGRVIANAEGNLLTGTTPMSAGVAQVVRPGTMRLIGDNPVADEAFIPLNGSARSTAILGEAANRMGYQLLAMAEGGIASMGRDTFPTDVDQQYGKNLVAALMAAAGGSSLPGPSGAVERWRPVVLQALAMLGQSPALANGVLSLIRSESGGNPNAINLWDSNARAGHPSRGLMQTIPATFEANRSRQLVDNIVDPLANIYAGINYALKRYGPGMLAAGGRHSASGGYVGYADGGTTPANQPFWVGERGPELMWSDRAQYVSTAEQSARVAASPVVPAASPGYGAAVPVGPTPQQTTVRVASGPVKVYLDGQEWRGMARVEAEDAIDRYDEATANAIGYAVGFHTD